MWDEPYLESCCRSALHRLALAGRFGRPSTEKDRACLKRLAGMGLAAERTDRRFELTEPGRTRHDREIGPLPGSAER